MDQDVVGSAILPLLVNSAIWMFHLDRFGGILTCSIVLCIKMQNRILTEYELVSVILQNKMEAFE